ncbi:HigA family addiction module antitoxin [Corynebacterium bovis]|uniref:HigA family addiction module antitoxin n=1 Tax=Corynebacterium bovis TaxID=36808 RepID=UPI003138CD1D
MRFNRASLEAFHVHGIPPKYIPSELRSTVRRKLIMLDSSHTINDLRTPPGNRLEILKGDIRDPLNISQYQLAKELDVQPSQISRIVTGQITISAAMAVRLAARFGNSAQFWFGISNAWELWNATQHTDTSAIPSPHHDTGYAS